MRKKQSITTTIFYITLILIISFSLARGACTTKDQAIKAVEILGFTDIEILDKSIFLVGFRGCNKNDAALYKVKATNLNGRKVMVNVCIGWPFKSATVRTPI